MVAASPGGERLNTGNFAVNVKNTTDLPPLLQNEWSNVGFQHQCLRRHSQDHGLSPRRALPMQATMLFQPKCFRKSVI